MAAFLLLLLRVESFTLFYSFEEELDIGSHVASLPGDLLERDPTVFGDWDISSLSFAGRGGLTDLLQFAPDGTIIIRDRVDREKLCNRSCTFLTPVHMLHYMNWSIYAFRIEFEVLDVNDNPPEFRVASLSLRIPQSTPVGFPIVIPGARDRDSPENSINKYVIAEVVPEFAVDSNSSTLKVTQKLKPGIFRFSVISYDPLVQDFRDDMLMVIRVTEDGESLGTALHVVVINEETRPGTILLPGGRISRYSLEKEEGNLRICPETGEVQLVQQLAMTSPRPRRISNVVVDWRGSAKWTLLLEVRKSYRSGPVVELGGSARVGENREHVAIKSFRVHYKYSAGKFADCFSPSSLVEVRKGPANTFSVVTKVSFDRERTEFVEIAVKCFDDGYPSQKTVKNLRLVIEDANDNLPFFFEPGNILEIFENQKVGTFVGNVAVGDIDATPQWQCGITENPYFLINRKTCGIYSKTSLDFEEANSVGITVHLTDPAFPDFLSSRDFVVGVRDLNDNPPSFVHPTCSIYAPVAIRGPFRVGSVLALDRDSGPNGRLKYSVERIQGTSEEADLRIDERGDVYLENRNTRRGRVIHFGVSVSDGGTPSLQTRRMCVLYILRLYEKYFFDYGIRSIELPTNSTGFVLENRNKKRNVQLRYQIFGGDFLAVDERTGNIYLTKSVENQVREKVLLVATSPRNYAYNKTLELFFYTPRVETTHYRGKILLTTVPVLLVGLFLAAVITLLWRRKSGGGRGVIELRRRDQLDGLAAKRQLDVGRLLNGKSVII